MLHRSCPFWVPRSDEGRIETQSYRRKSGASRIGKVGRCFGRRGRIRALRNALERLRPASWP
eukprot:4954331-Pyramimonas_sp.AAC.1